MSLWDGELTDGLVDKLENYQAQADELTGELKIGRTNWQSDSQAVGQADKQAEDPVFQWKAVVHKHYVLSKGLQ